MKVLYDSQAFSQKYGGVSKSFCELISNLPPYVQWEIAIKQSNNIHLLQQNLLNDLERPQLSFDNFLMKRNFKGKHKLFNLCNKLFPSIPFMEQINRKYEIELLTKGDFDVFHPTFFQDYFLQFLGKKPFVLTVHDMMPELFPQYFNINDIQVQKKRKLANMASAIVAVSEKTKEDAACILGINPDKITVIYHGGPEMKKIQHNPIIKGKYILYVGNRNAYKNFEQFIEGVSTFIKSKPEVSIICTGPEFTKAEKKLFYNWNLSNNIAHLSVNDYELQNLYSYAQVFVYPSLYEGFGMPILEAFAHGCPVLLSKCSCFPEIAGKAAVYYDTNLGANELASKLAYVYSLPSEQKDKLIQSGYMQLSLYSWKDSARRLAELYKSITS